jgi:hypothetical protein
LELPVRLIFDFPTLVVFSIGTFFM